MEQALLLPKDMADLRSMRKHEVFLDLKRDLAMVSPLTPSLFYLIYFYLFFITSFSSFVICFSLSQVVQATYRVEEMVNYSYWHKRGRRETYSGCGGLLCGRKK